MIFLNVLNDPFKRILTITCLIFRLLSPTIGKAENLVTVQLKSGRTYTALVDHRTNDSHLWLRFQTLATTLLRPIRWDKVETSLVGNEQLDKASFQKFIKTLAVEDLKEIATKDHLASEEEKPFPVSISNEVNESKKRISIADRAVDALGSLPRVSSVSFDTVLSNWDADTEVDGLVLSIYPRDATQRLIPVNGIVHIELHAFRNRSQPNSPRNGNQAMEALGRWVKQVRPKDLKHSEYTFRLPFQAIHPNFDLGVDHFGVLHVRLVVPGHGVFEETLDTVRIRPFSPLRDWQQLISFKRFFAFERTGRSQ